MAKRAAAFLLAVGSVALMAAAFTGRVPYKPAEAIGFVTGAWGVYLVVLENVWNWPIGVVSSGFYVVVFAEARLFGDAALNVLYVILGLLGWYWWLNGGRRGEGPRAELAISALSPIGFAAALGATAALTAGLTWYFRSIRDAAPFLDALTTALSLVAQGLLTRKILENWIFWIVADAVYIPLYYSRGLALTSLLYALFLAMAVGGYLEWRRKHRAALLPTHG